MATPSIQSSVISELQAYPFLVTGQIVPEIDSLQRNHAATRIDGTTRATNRRPFTRLHHTVRFGVPR